MLNPSGVSHTIEDPAVLGEIDAAFGSGHVEP
jgi:hypothetical protein